MLNDDLRIFGASPVGRLVLIAGLLLGVGAPMLIGVYPLTQLLFIVIYAIAGLGLQLLTGYAGQLSLGHAAFLAIGAYGCAYLERNGVMFPAALAIGCGIAVIVGVIVARPALRMSGIYLLTATIAFGFIVEEIGGRWTAVTGGNSGMFLPTPNLFGLQITELYQLYYIAFFLLVCGLLIASNVIRAPLGRAMVAVRDSEIAAQSMGINVARTKTLAFGLSAGFCAVAGALFGHVLGYVTPDQFGVLLSVDLLVILLIGGTGSLRGVLLGSAFVVLLPEVLRIFTWLTGASGEVIGVRPVVEGLAVILVMLFEPSGLNGIWIRIRRLVMRGRSASPSLDTPGAPLS